MYDLAIKGGQVYLNGKWCTTHVYIQSEHIAELTVKNLPARKVIDAAGQKVIPGLIDPHVHLAMSSGAFQTADDFETGSIAAAYGGVTTFIDFLDEQSTSFALREEFQRKLALAEKSFIDYGLHAAAKELEEPANSFVDTALQIRSPTIKLYTTYKPSAYSSPKTVRALIEATSHREALILCHSEMDSLLSFDSTEINRLSKNRPVNAEVEQVAEIAGFAEETQGFAYIVHTSAGSTIEMLLKKYSNLLKTRLFLEGCPQYFLFNTEVFAGAGADAALYTCTPPIREEMERQKLTQLWKNLSTFATDHCPFFQADKFSGKLDQIPMGIGGVERSFGLMYTLFGDQVIDRFTRNTAILHGLYPRKGVIAHGSDADLVIFHDTEPHRYGQEHSAVDYSLYTDQDVRIEIDTVISRGHILVQGQKLFPHKGKFQQRALLHANFGMIASESNHSSGDL